MGHVGYDRRRLRTDSKGILLKDNTRRGIANFLKDNPNSRVGIIAEKTGLDYHKITYHLHKLGKGRHVVKEDGRNPTYRLAAGVKESL